MSFLGKKIDGENESYYDWFVYHYSELRIRILNCMAAYAVLFMTCLYYAEDIYGIISAPILEVLGQNNSMIFTHVTEVFECQFKLAAYFAFLFLIPLISFELYAFVRPALYEHEVVFVRLCAIISPFLFIIAWVFVLKVAMPFIIKFFISFGSGSIVMSEFKPKMDQYLYFFFELVTTFGIMFQFPILISTLVKLDVIKPSTLKKYRRHSIVIIFILAAILTPPDVLSQIMLALPLILLYEISIILAKFIENRKYARY